MKQHKALAATFITPAFLFFCLFTLLPIIEVIRMSFLKINFITSVYVGFDNYKTIFKDEAFLLSIGNSFVYAIITLLGVCTSVFFAFFLYHMTKRWQDTVRILLYLPVLSAGIIISSAWGWIFHQKGVINWLLQSDINWFGQASTAIPAISIMVIHAGFGLNTIVILANLQGIGKEYIEAAVIDGATWWQIQWHIMIPMIAPILYMIIISTIIGAFMVFEYIMMVAPYSYTATMAYSIFQKGFEFSRYGIASAQAVVLLCISVGLFMLKKQVKAW